MKHLQNVQSWLRSWASMLAVAMLLLSMAGCHKFPNQPAPKTTLVADGLQAPMGIETDWKGNIWVAETGTANNDGKVVVITPDRNPHDKKGAKVYDAIINLASIKNALSNEVEGPAHLLFDKGMLWILAGDMLYHADLTHYKPGDAPIDAGTLPSEDIGSYVRSLNIVTPNDSHPYNLIKGPDGNLYIVDAGANAIIKRTGAGHYSVLAKFPLIKNPTPVGPPMTQSVPTAIILDRGSFLVTTLTGFPFPQGQAVIYKVTMSGDVSVYRKGFTTLVDIAEGNYYGNVLLHYGSFGPTGFVPNTGSLLFSDGQSSDVIVDKLNMPSGLKQINNHSWYVTSLGDGTLMKISYE